MCVCVCDFNAFIVLFLAQERPSNQNHNPKVNLDQSQFAIEKKTYICYITAPEPAIEENKRKRHIILSDSEDEEDKVEEKKIKTTVQPKDVEMKEASKPLENDEITHKVKEMQVDSQLVLDHSDDETFDKEVEEAAAEEKEAKQEKLEMMSIIHTM